MVNTPTVSMIFDDLSALGEDVTSLYLPRPPIAQGLEKWRILKKNAVATLEESAPDAPKLIEELSRLELSDFHGLGLALFAAADEVKIMHLTHRPLPILKTRGSALMLPALADNSSTRARWVAIIDRDTPRLVVVNGSEVDDHTSSLDHMTYERVAKIRDEQSNVMFHSIARGGISAGDTGTAFHALGTGSDEEEEKAEDDFYRSFAKAVEAAVPPNTDHVVLAGDPRRTGRCAQHFKRLQTQQMHGAGEALEDKNLAHSVQELPHVEEHPPEGRSNRGGKDLETPSGLSAAAKQGRVATLSIDLHACGLDLDNADEHTKIRMWHDVPNVSALDEVARSALTTGATLDFQVNGSGQQVSGTARWAV
ncbi:hypothetical protein [Pyruvatibacter sp.]|uniref:hypothetical protein n=1 Tax=Pyruvatibacter sp. TaxID=1981328 RepID=UPI0032EC4249